MAKILIVDDSRTSRKVMRSILEGAGHEIVGEAGNGMEGVRLYFELYPDLTTMDITMPELNGIEALKKILDKNADAKIIMVTAAGQKEKMVDAIKAGAVEFITKPYEPAELCEKINNVLNYA